MTRGRRRRRAAVLISLALACGGLAAERVQTRASEVESQIGGLVPVLVTRADVPPGGRLRAPQLAVRQVPERFVPRDALTSPEQVVGQRVAGALATGDYVTSGALTTRSPDDHAPGRPLRNGERSVDVAVAGGEALTGSPPGTRVDVLVTTEERSGTGGGRTFLALQDVELLGARAASEAQQATGGDGAASRATTLATLRVTLRQAVYLTAAQSFAREVRLLARSPGDRRSAGPLAVQASGL
jgi:pilus assembly protein CpaB